jgi:antitoxin component YwqK of YwqJK toxin-antitoxin module
MSCRSEYRVGDFDGGPYWVEYKIDSNGREDGLSVFWTSEEPRRRISEYTYKAGVLHGEYRIYHNDGRTLKEDGSFCDGQRCGETHVYDECGVVYVSCMYDRGLLNGLFMIWYDYKNRRPLMRVLCKDDVFVYKYAYFPDGKLDELEEYDLQGGIYEKKVFSYVGKSCLETTTNYKYNTIRYDWYKRTPPSI